MVCEHRKQFSLYVIKISLFQAKWITIVIDEYSYRRKVNNFAEKFLLQEDWNCQKAKSYQAIHIILSSLDRKSKNVDVFFFYSCLQTPHTNIANYYKE